MLSILLVWLCSIGLQSFTLGRISNLQLENLSYLYLRAVQENISPEKLTLLAECESRFETDRIGDTDKICGATGKPIRSRGLFQINDCAWPEVSDKQAEDFYWATDWAIDMIKGGRVTAWWTCSKIAGFR